MKYKTMFDLMARGALQSLSLLHKDTLSDFRMLSTVYCNMSIILLFVGCTHLCIGSIQVGIL